MKHLLAVCLIFLSLAALEAKPSAKADQLVLLEAAKAKVTEARSNLAKAQARAARQEGEIKQLEAAVKTAEAEVARVTEIKDALVKDLESLHSKHEKLEKKQLQTGRERDVFLFAFAVALAGALYSPLRKILALIPPPYNLAAQIAAPVVLLVGGFYAGRLAVQWVVNLIF